MDESSKAAAGRVIRAFRARYGARRAAASSRICALMRGRLARLVTRERRMFFYEQVARVRACVACVRRVRACVACVRASRAYVRARG